MADGLRTIVCGGRDYDDAMAVYHALDDFDAAHGIAVVAHGGAAGADDLARNWAMMGGIPVVSYPANWKAEGKAAGPKRNQRMLDEFKPDVVIAFPGGRGTADMIRRAEAHGVKVVRVSE